jgi:sugar transferase (PEP-CTERM/EpsH1 system associated)
MCAVLSDDLVTTPIRIMHVLDNLGTGGTQIALANLIERMDQVRFEHVLCGMRPLDISGPNYFDIRLPQGLVRTVSLRRRAANSKAQVASLSRLIHEIKPDIVHSRNWSAIEGVIAGRLIRTRAIVHSEHGLDSVSIEKEPWRRIVFRRLAFELADRVVCVSHQLRGIHSRRTGFPQHKMTVIHNGVDTKRYYPNPAIRTQIREELKIPENDFCIGCVGNLTPVKDYMTVFNAIEKVAKVCTDWRLVIIGKGPELPKLQHWLSTHAELRSRVAFLGLSERVPEMLNAMDMYVLSSITEGISNSLLEAMATSLPVTVTCTGGNPEVVVESHGLLFPVGDFSTLAEHILLLRSRTDLRSKFGNSALKRVREFFSLDTMARRYEEVYESVHRLR